jgi:branched-chain amino acid transport system ATP-binding protein
MGSRSACRQRLFPGGQPARITVASQRLPLRATLEDVASQTVAISPAADAALRLLGLEALVGEMPSELTQGQRKLVGIARALAAEPRVICLDEPAAGLDVQESSELAQRLRRVVDAGTSMLLIDHDMGLVLGISDEVVVLEFGTVIARGSPDAVRRDARVIEAYLGGAATATTIAGMDAAANRLTRPSTEAS